MKKKEINGYNLIKFFYERMDAHQDMCDHCKPRHIALFLRVLEIQNQIGWKTKTIGLPTENTMHYARIGNDKTYRRTVEELISWDVLKEVSKSVNQHQSRKVSFHTDALYAYLNITSASVKNTEAVTEAHTEAPAQAMIEADTQATPQARSEAVPSYKTVKTINSAAFPKEGADELKTVNCKPVNEEAKASLSASRKDIIETLLFFHGVKDGDRFQTNRFISYNKDKDIEQMPNSELGELVKQFASNVQGETRDIADQKKLNMKLGSIKQWIEGGRNPILQADKDMIKKEPMKKVYTHFAQLGIYLSAHSMERLLMELGKSIESDMDRVKFVLVQKFDDYKSAIKTYNQLVEVFPKMHRSLQGYNN